MDLSKVNGNERLALFGAIAVFFGGIISNWGGLFWLAVLAAVGVAVVVFLPQFAPGTSLPGSKGTLLAGLGIVAIVAGVIELLRFLGYYFANIADLDVIAFTVALVGALVMAYGGWMELQKEGGKWQFRSIGGSSSAAAPAATAPPAAAAPGPTPMPASEPVASEPVAPASGPTAADEDPPAGA
jgi:hypothetical protein